VRADDADGSTWPAPSIVEAGQVGTYPTLLIVNGRPAIAYKDDANQALKYIRAVDADGTSWGTSLTLVPEDVGDFLSMALVNGNPAIAYTDAANLMYINAEDADGSSWDTPVFTGDYANWCSLAEVDGLPLVAFGRNSQGLKIELGSDADGDGWELPLPIDSTGDRSPSIIDLGNRPAIAYADPPKTLKFARRPPDG
jgi:hypothetical protein